MGGREEMEAVLIVLPELVVLPKNVVANISEAEVYVETEDDSVDNPKANQTQNCPVTGLKDLSEALRKTKDIV